MPLTPACFIEPITMTHTKEANLVHNLIPTLQSHAMFYSRPMPLHKESCCNLKRKF